MGIVTYKFEYNPAHIEIPDAIKFGNVSANIIGDKKSDGLIEGEVDFVPLDTQGRLAVNVRVRGKNPFVWTLSVHYDGRETVEFPIVRPIPINGFYAATGLHNLKPL